MSLLQLLQHAAQEPRPVAASGGNRSGRAKTGGIKAGQKHLSIGQKFIAIAAPPGDLLGGFWGAPGGLLRGGERTVGFPY